MKTPRFHQLTTRLRSFTSHANEQAKLILLASLPGLLLSLFLLHYFVASWYLFFFVFLLFSLIIVFAMVNGKNKAEHHIQTLSNLVEAMIEGDFTLRGNKRSNPAFSELLNLINSLADTLNQQKLRVEESQHLLNKIMDQMDTLLLATDQTTQLTMVNAGARQWLSLKPNEELAKVDLKTLGLNQLLSAKSNQLLTLTDEHFAGEYFIVKDQFIHNNQTHQLYMLTRAELALKSKERQAWQRLVRVLSHELNNSLTPISTFSGTLLRKIEKEGTLTSPDKFRQGLTIIKERAETLSTFIASYSQLSHLATPTKQDYSWFEKLSNLSRLYPSCHFEFNIDNTTPKTIAADPAQLEQVFVNVLKNAIEAMSNSSQQRVEISAQVMNSMLAIEIQDNGQGVANLDNLFVPYYTTKAGGTGIGLVLCQQIILNHGGKIELKNRANGQGATVSICLPIK